MKNNNLYTAIFLAISVVSFSCKKNHNDILIPYPNIITFEDQTLGRFTFNIPSAPFTSGDDKSGKVTVNVKNNGDGTYSGFAISNKNWRSYPWNLSPDFAPGSITPEQLKSSVDSTIFSVYTTSTNKTENFLVACVKDDDASITINTPSVVEHVLVANTSYNYLLESYGSQYSGTLDAGTQMYSLTGTKARNIQNPNTATAFYGRFTLPGPGGSNLIRLAGDEILSKMDAGHTAAEAARTGGKTEEEALDDSTAAAAALSKGYVKLTINGFNGASTTGSVDYWLAIRPNVDPANPTLNYVASNWFPVDLTSLGVVDKLVFHLSSSYTDMSGQMAYPPYFCLDGIQLKQ
jgi:hypothetical protein